jgi:hypothetical protein
MTGWLPLHMNAVPAALRALNWVGWRAERGDDDRWRKIPWQIGAPSAKASSTDPATWRGEGDVREVLALAPDLFDGFGVALVGGICFLDFDGVRDPETGALADWAARMVELFASWSEVSVSGTGVHIFCRAQLPGGGVVGYLDGDPARKVEIYDKGRFAYLTGHALEPVRPLAERQRLVERLVQCVHPTPGGGASRATTRRDDAPIAEGQRNDALFRIARGFVLHGLRGPDLAAALAAVNARRCRPPLPSAEVAALARHAERLPDRAS